MKMQSVVWYRAILALTNSCFSYNLTEKNAPHYNYRLLRHNPHHHIYHNRGRQQQQQQQQHQQHHHHQQQQQFKN